MKKLPNFLEALDPNIYKSENFLVVDFETTNLDYGSALQPDNRLLMAVWWSPTFGWKEIVGNEYEMGPLLDDIASVDFVIAHNTKFELQWLAKCGSDIGTILPYDTMLGDYVLSGNRQFRVSLAACAKRYKLGHKTDWVSKYLKDGTCLSELPSSSVLKYCRQDVKLTAEVFYRQRRKLVDRNLLPVAYTRNIFTPVLADIEAHGMHIDKEQVVLEYKQVFKEHAAICERIDELTGGINPNSNPQKANFFYKEMGFRIPLQDTGKPYVGKPTKDWPDGLPKTNKDAIAALKPSNARQRLCCELFKEQSMLDTKLSKTLKPLYTCCIENKDQLLYAKFNQAVTKTHRLSSTGRKYGCQFQNFPRKYKH